MFQDNLYSTKIYSMSEINDFIETSMFHVKQFKTNKKISYYNVACSFDIETSSFYIDGKKNATMYIWQFGINGLCLIGRTWEEFTTLIQALIDTLDLSDNNRLIVYVHNLSYEFQFMRYWFEWSKVFSIDTRKPIYAITEDGVEFRCSYLLSGYSLKSLGKNLLHYPIKKMVGDLDYNLIRHSTTPLTDKELGYCINDIKVVMSYIQEQIEIKGNITELPITKTGAVRRYCREKCYKDPNKKIQKRKAYNYHCLMKSLTIGSVEEYDMLKRAFQGGFTHASAYYSGKELQDVASYDFTSSYPYVCCAFRFPMSNGEKITIKSREQFIHNLQCYCCIFDIRFHNLQPKMLYENYLSSSRCFGITNGVTNNGRLVSCDECITTITDVDFRILRKCYTWDSIDIGTFYRYQRGYLPKSIILSILELYGKKTELKNVKGKETEYMASKELVNSVYGCMVSDVLRDTITYECDSWGIDPPDKEKALDKHNNSWNRFLFYPWGVFVTAYARYNLWTGIFEFGESGDFVYSDTDSVKVLNYKNHENYINAYNQDVINKLNSMCDYYNISREKYKPKTVKGIEKPLGVWDFEGIYSRFKTLGAKRYMVEKNGKIEITVSGLNKGITTPYLLETYGKDVFKHFNDNMYIPKGKTGKNTHTYIDEEIHNTITDYLGTTNEFYEKSFIHMESSDYSLSLPSKYVNYIFGIQTQIQGG